MQIIPIKDTPSQTLQANLNNQLCRIDLLTKRRGLFCNLYINDELIIGGVYCLDRNLIVRDGYLGFSGDLCFVDTQGTDKPSSPGLGSRFQFCYLDTFDIAGT